jgi:hypothetical protein
MGLGGLDLVQWSEIVRNIGLIAGGAFGLWLAWRRVSATNKQATAALRQAELARRDHVAELFNRAVGQLADEKLEVRLGAIFTLRQIRHDFGDLTAAVDELLTTYLRERGTSYGDAEPPVDVREIMKTVTHRPPPAIGGDR